MTPAAIEQLTWILGRSQQRAAVAWKAVDLARQEALLLGHEAQAIHGIIKMHELELKEHQFDSISDLQGRDDQSSHHSGLESDEQELAE